MGAACSSDNSTAVQSHQQANHPSANNTKLPTAPSSQSSHEPPPPEQQIKADQPSSQVNSPTVVLKQEAVENVESGKPSVENQSSGLAWKQLLMELSNEDPWGGERRDDRPYWRDLLEKAKELVNKPRKKLPEARVMEVLRGDLALSGSGKVADLSDRQTRVTIFVSSTFTDTRAERNLLMRDVYPYLRRLCRFLDMDFGTVDMRWGVKEELALEHGTTEICINEVQRCLRESAGPAFLAILSHKYGYRTLPVEIAQAEYEKLLGLLEAESEDTKIIRDFYALDTNALPPMYVLQPRDPDDSDWWNREKQIIALFRKVAKQLGEEEAEKYFISITEKEVKTGFLNNDSFSDQVICLTRQLVDVQEERHLDRHIIDMKSGAVDDDAQAYLTDLKTDKIAQKVVGTSDVKLDFDYQRDNVESVRQNVVETCDKVCDNISRRILAAYETHHHVELDPVYDEVIQHRKFAAQKSEVYVGREDLINAIGTHVKISEGKESKVYGVYGTSGCGKTALMAMAAKNIKEKVLPNATIVLRFMGTTQHSGSARAVLYSVCSQIARVYGKTTEFPVPSGYSELIDYFQEVLKWGTANQPIVVLLDSLDQLSNEDFGQNLKWLSLKESVPAHAHVIVSSIPGGCLDALQAYLPEDKLLHVANMSSSDGPELLSEMLAAQKRTVTQAQRAIILDAFNKCPLPLFLRLAVDIAAKWKSYDIIDSSEIADDMPGLINILFQRIESRFGDMFVERALAYITCAKDGLSVGELEDILSCDDEVLDYLFDFWLPPFRRVPQLLWIRVRNELGAYLTERGTNGVNAYGWYHRQFWETAATRYLDDNNFRPRAHEAVADYFEGKWAEGKMWTPQKLTRAITDLTPRMEKRQVPRQPISLTGSRHTSRQLNRRKLAELPAHILALQDWDRLEKQIATLEFVEAKFEAGQGYECRSLFLRAADQSGRKHIKAMSKFIGLGLAHFLDEPFGVYQLAGQQVQGNPIRALFDNSYDSIKEEMPIKFSRNLVEVGVDDPCEMTMKGHTSGIRCVRYNPKGHLIASTAEDGSVRMWDTFSGAEVVTVTGLPGPRYSGLADPYHGERPCCWDQEGKLLASGSEDGGVQVWDTNGAQVFPDVLINGCNFHWAQAVLRKIDGVGLKVAYLQCGPVRSRLRLLFALPFVPAERIPAAFDKIAVDVPEGPMKEVFDYVRQTWITGRYPPSTWSVYSKTIRTNNAHEGWHNRCNHKVRAMTPHTGAVTGIEISPDNSTLVTASKDGFLKAWSMKDFSMLAEVSVGNCLGCTFSPDGHTVAVSLYDSVGLKRVRVSDWTVTEQGRGTASLNLCVAWSPLGNVIVTGGDNSSITIWDSNTLNVLNVLGGHRGWIWCVHFNSTGRWLLSCSSDRSMKFWDCNTGQCVVSLGGHTHRVTWVSFRPGKEETFVTASLDTNLKVWDTEAVAAGRTPPAGSLHYSILQVSPCARYVASCQGWSKQCNFIDAQTDQALGQSPTHGGFILSAVFTHDSSKFVTVDTGHSGDYGAGAEKNSQVMVCFVPNGGNVVNLQVYGGNGVAAHAECILVSTCESKVLVFDINSLELLHTFEFGEVKISRIACTLNSGLVALAGSKEIVVKKVTESSAGLNANTVFSVTYPGQVVALVFSPSGNYLAVGMYNGHIKILRADDACFAELHELDKCKGRIDCAVFSHGQNDGFFVSASIDLTVRVWDVKNHFRLHAIFYGPTNQVAFLKRNVLAIGESTGNKKTVEFEV